MAGQEELEIEISPDGQVQVHVKGRPGSGCLDYVQLFRALLSGEVTDQQLTEEYYQQQAQGQVQQRVRQDRQ